MMNNRRQNVTSWQAIGSIIPTVVFRSGLIMLSKQDKAFLPKGNDIYFTIPSIDEVDLPSPVYELVRRGLLKFNPEKTTAGWIVMSLTAKGRRTLERK